MGVGNSPNIFQQKMNDLFHAFKFICVCTDEVLILTRGDWKDNVHKLEWTLNKLKDKGIKCNIEMFFFVQIKMEYLGFWVTRNGIKPINKKMETIINMNPPTYKKISANIYRCSKLILKYVAKEFTCVSSFNYNGVQQKEI